MHVRNPFLLFLNLLISNFLYFRLSGKLATEFVILFNVCCTTIFLILETILDYRLHVVLLNIVVFCLKPEMHGTMKIIILFFSFMVLVTSSDDCSSK